MNIILILVDSLNKKHLKIYNQETACKTPVLDDLATRATIFDNHFVGSLPCMPARRDFFAGRKEFLWRPWGPLEVFDARLPIVLRQAGYHTGMVTDHYHYWEEMANGYMQGFSSLELIRGHETDFWKLPESGPVPKWVDNIAQYRADEHPRQFYANIKDFTSEEDFFPAQVFSKAADWLGENANSGKPFFLQVENFDVHEPYFVPEPYASMYTDKSRDDFNIWPPYQVYKDLDRFFDEASPEQMEFLKSQYMGKVTMCDHWMGVMLDKLTELKLWDDTMVIFTTDHGHDLGDRRAFGKQFPHYDSHANIPMVIWRPGDKPGSRVGALTQTVDLFATIIETAGAPIPESNRHSVSLLPALSGDKPRDAVMYGTFGQGVCVTDGQWSLFKAPVKGKALNTYSTMINRPLVVDNPIDGRVGRLPDPPVDQGYFDSTVPLPLWKMPIQIDARTHENFLFNRQADPEQKNNLWETETTERDRMLDLLRELIVQEGAPPEQLERLGLTA